MADDPIREARRRARAMSRAQDIGYQQALDSVAREAGHGTWSAMLTAQGATAAPPPSVPATSEPRPNAGDWRLVALERLEGSRHSPVDEAGIATVGRSIANVARAVRIPVLAVAALLPAVLLLAFRGLTYGGLGMDVFQTAFTVLATVPFGLAALRCPDHSGSRRVRRMAQVGALMTVILCICFTLPTALKLGFESVDQIGDGPFRIALSMMVFTMSMWACAWEGRRIRRMAGRSS